MAATLSLLQVGPFDGTDVSQSLMRVYFKVTPSGTYTALGDLLDFTVLAGTPILSSTAPIFVNIESAKSGSSSGFLYAYIPGATPTQANGKIQVLQYPAVAGPAVDIGAGAYPAGVTADTIIGFADFVRL